MRRSALIFQSAHAKRGGINFLYILQPLVHLGVGLPIQVPDIICWCGEWSDRVHANDRYWVPRGATLDPGPGAAACYKLTLATQPLPVTESPP